MKKSLLTVLSLMLAAVALESEAARGMSANQQEACRKACMKRGDKWDPSSAENGKGCTCLTGDVERDSYTITDSDLGQTQLDNVVGKTKQ